MLNVSQVLNIILIVLLTLDLNRQLIKKFEHKATKTKAISGQI